MTNPSGKLTSGKTSLPMPETPRQRNLQGGNPQLIETATTIQHSPAVNIPLPPLPASSLTGRVTPRSPREGGSPQPHLQLRSPPLPIPPLPPITSLSVSPGSKRPPPLPPYPCTPPGLSPRGSPRSDDDSPKWPAPPLPISPRGNTGNSSFLLREAIPKLIFSDTPHSLEDSEERELKDHLHLKAHLSARAHSAEKPKLPRRSRSEGEGLTRSPRVAQTEEREKTSSKKKEKHRPRSISADETIPSFQAILPRESAVRHPQSSFTVSRIGSGFDVRLMLPELMKLFSSKEFDVETAETELSNCIRDHFPNRKKEIINYLKDLLTNIDRRRPKYRAIYEDRYYRVIALVLIRPGNEDFICAYLKKMRLKHSTFPTNQEFAALVIGKLKGVDKYFSGVLAAIDCFTQKDLICGGSAVLFREDCLSSSLGQAFACIVWEKELKGLNELISKKLEGKTLKLCLNFTGEEGELKGKKQKSEPSKDEVGQQPDFDGHPFMQFAKDVLDYIFPIDHSSATHVPAVMQRMLTMRRMLIINYLKSESKIKDSGCLALSRSYIGELLCLRIINPSILAYQPSAPKDKDKVLHVLASLNPFASSSSAESIASDVLLQNILGKLTKVIQKIANETPPTEPLFFSLYSSYVNQYNDFVDKYSLEKPSQD